MGGPTQSPPAPASLGRRMRTGKLAALVAAVRGGLAEGLAHLSRWFEIGASRGKMLRGVGMSVSRPPPGIPNFRSAQGPPGTPMAEAPRWLLRGRTWEPPTPSQTPPLPVAIPVSSYTFVSVSEVKEGLQGQWVMLGAGPKAVPFFSRLD